MLSPGVPSFGTSFVAGATAGSVSSLKVLPVFGSLFFSYLKINSATSTMILVCLSWNLL
jgi:hypothetical protein